MDNLTLRVMRPGDSGRIAALTLKNGAARRLAEFGFVRGAHVEMLLAGAPCIVRLDQTRISLGSALQEGVMVAREPVGLASGLV